MAVTSPQDLYGLPLPEFIPERTALVKALRADQQREEAAAVAAMRKPSVAAWAVNQLVRTQSASVRTLFKAGDDLAAAQSDAASGKGAADALRAATRRQRDALDELVEASRGLLSSDGHPLTPATLERVRQTLVAASLDGASREQVKDGCLAVELEFAGLGIGELSPEPVDAPPAKPKKTTDAGKSRDAEQAREAEAEAAQKAEAAARERRAALSAARKAATGARRAANRAEKELADAQAARDDAAEALRQTEKRVAQATDEAEKTAAALTQAERSVRELSED